MLPLLEPQASEVVAPCCPPLTERPFTAEEAETAARMFKALGDLVRLRLRLRLFSAAASHDGGEVCVCDISDVGVSPGSATASSRPCRRPWESCSPWRRPLSDYPYASGRAGRTGERVLDDDDPGVFRRYSLERQRLGQTV